MYCPVCRMVHLKDILLLNEKSCARSGGSRFPLLLTEWKEGNVLFNDALNTF